MRLLTSLSTALVLAFVTLTAGVGCATSGSGDDLYSELDGEATHAGKLAFWQSPNDEWRFHLKAGNGAILLTSEGYVTRMGAIGGALSVLDNGVDPAMYRVKETPTGHTLHLVARNGESIGYSEVYASKSNATRAIDACVRAVTSYLDKREASSTGARFDVRFDEDTSAYRFDVYSKTDEIVLSSGQYQSQAAAYNGAFAVQAAGGNSSAYDFAQDVEGSWYFTVQAPNGKVVGVSGLYATRAAALAGADALIKLSPTLTVL